MATVEIDNAIAAIHHVDCPCKALIFPEGILGERGGRRSFWICFPWRSAFARTHIGFRRAMADCIIQIFWSPSSVWEVLGILVDIEGR